jgi:2-phosphosulfolactate phosphatase
MTGIRVTIHDWAGPADQVSNDHIGPPEVVVVIDVIRAFTTAAVLLARRARQIICVDTAAEALALARTTSPFSLVVGEQLHPPFPVVDLPNSPVAALSAQVLERTVTFFTANGTRALAATAPVATVLAASLVNAGATADWIRVHHPDAPIRLIVTDPGGPEDRGCALHLGALLTTGTGRPAAARSAAVAGVDSHRRRWARHVPPEVWQDFLADSEICAQLDAWPVVLLGTRGPGGAVTLSRGQAAPRAGS